MGEEPGQQGSEDAHSSGQEAPRSARQEGVHVEATVIELRACCDLVDY